VPELEWSDKCTHWAYQCAKECHKLNSMHHCFTTESECEGVSYGQNIFTGSLMFNENTAVETWYNEL